MKKLMIAFVTATMLFASCTKVEPPPFIKERYLKTHNYVTVSGEFHDQHDTNIATLIRDGVQKDGHWDFNDFFRSPVPGQSSFQFEELDGWGDYAGVLVFTVRYNGSKFLNYTYNGTAEWAVTEATGTLSHFMDMSAGTMNYTLNDFPAEEEGGATYPEYSIILKGYAKK